MNNRVKYFLRNVLYSIVANGITMFVSVLTVLLIPKFISVEAYGYSQVYVFYSNYIGFLHLGLADGIYLRFGGQSYKELDKPLFLSQFWISTLGEIIEVVCLISIYLIFNSNNNKNYVFIMLAVAAIIVLPRTYFQMILQTTGRIEEYGKLLISEKIVYCFLVILFILFDSLSFQTVILSDVIGKLFSFLITVSFCKEMVYGKWVSITKALKEIGINIYVGSKLMISNVASLLLIGIIRIGIEFRWNVETYGKVSLAINISNFILVFINAIGIVIFPMLKKMDEKKLPQLFQNLKITLSVILLGILIFYYPVRLLTINWLPNYQESIQYMVLIFPICFYECQMAMLINTYLKAYRKEKQIAVINGIAVFMSLLLTLVSTVVFKDLLMAFLSIHLVYMIRFLIANIYICKIINQKNLCILECILCLSFSLLGWITDMQTSFNIYIFLYVLYLWIRRQNIKKSILQIKELCKS